LSIALTLKSEVVAIIITNSNYIKKGFEVTRGVEPPYTVLQTAA
jgi:hypothetical protein